MFALARYGGRPVWVDVPQKDFGPGDVVVRVNLVGLCRTDLAVARGEIAVEEPRILGHEFSGTVIAVGADVDDIRVGDRVAANPMISCGTCEQCRANIEQACGDRLFLGVDRDGAIAETIVIPAKNAWTMPAEMDDRAAAMLEPVAACAAVTGAPINPSQRGIVLGKDRLARLTELILREYGFANLLRSDPSGEDPRENMPDLFDFAIDTTGSTLGIQRLLGALRPRGVLILKSRPAEPISLDLRTMLPKEPSIHLVNYAPFEEARRLLVDSKMDISELLGPIWPADEADKALETAATDDRVKHFIAMQTFGSIRATNYGSVPEGVRNRCLSL